MHITTYKKIYDAELNEISFINKNLYFKKFPFKVTMK